MAMHREHELHNRRWGRNLGVALTLAAFGYQNQLYYTKRPEAFGRHPHLKRDDIVGRLSSLGASVSRIRR